MLNCLRLFAVMLTIAGLLDAQGDANRGQLMGTVFDGKGAGVSGAKVTIAHVTTGVIRAVVAGTDGQYRAVQLDAGRYEVTAESAGFAASCARCS